MAVNTLPRFNMDNAETGCCPRFDPAGWEGAEIEFRDRLFLKTTTVNFLHVPLNMGAAMAKAWRTIQAAGAAPEGEYLILSTDPSPWRGEHYLAVAKEIPGATMARLSGTYLAKVFEGPYRDAGRWVREMERHVGSAGKQFKRLYFFYTTCPKCAKRFGKNYVVGFAEV